MISMGSLITYPDFLFSLQHLHQQTNLASMPVVEIATFPASDAFIADPTSIKAPVANIIAKAPGFIRYALYMPAHRERRAHQAVQYVVPTSASRLRTRRRDTSPSVSY